MVRTAFAFTTVAVRVAHRLTAIRWLLGSAAVLGLSIPILAFLYDACYNACVGRIIVEV